jgi:uncharacterized protein YicC (UPF0701 family)
VTRNEPKRLFEALHHNLKDKEALTLFCEEYAKEGNRLQAEASSNRGALEHYLAAAKKDHAKLIDAILAGVPAEQVKDRMIALNARRIELEAQLSRDTVAPHLWRRLQLELRSHLVLFQFHSGCDAANSHIRAIVVVSP